MADKEIQTEQFEAVSPLVEVDLSLHRGECHKRDFLNFLPYLSYFLLLHVLGKFLKPQLIAILKQPIVLCIFLNGVIRQMYKVVTNIIRRIHLRRCAYIPLFAEIQLHLVCE